MNKKAYDPSLFPKIQDHGLKISVGIFLILFTLLGFLNQDFFSGLINLFFGLLIGKLRILGFILILAYGIRLILNRSFIRLRFNITSLGLSLILLSTLGLFTAQDYITAELDQSSLTLTTFFSTFFTHFPPLNNIPLDFGNRPIGGGLIGYAVIAVINLLNIPSFNQIVLITSLVVGVMLSLEYVWLKIFNSVIQSFELQQQDKEIFKKVTQTKPPELSSQIVSEVSEKDGEIKSYRALFPTQTVPGLAPVTFVKPSASKPSTPPPTHKQETPAPTVVQTAPPLKFFDPLDETLDETAETPSFQPSIPEVKTQSPMTKPPLVFPTTPPSKPSVSSTFKTEEPTTMPSAYTLYKAPSMTLLETRLNQEDYDFNAEATTRRVHILSQKFVSLGVDAEVVGFQIGPSVTSFDIQMHEGSQTQQVKKVVRDLGIALGGFDPIFKEIVPGRAVSSLEVLNERAAMVGFKEMIADLRTKAHYGKRLLLPFGRNMQGEVVSFSAKDMIHLLVAGSSGSGKTVFVHSFISSILMEATPEQAKILLIDPKKFELNKYKDLPHLICPIISDVSEAKVALERLIDEMEDRYQQLLDSDTSSLDQFNQFCLERGDTPLPLIFAIIDEYNDLINTNPQVSELVQRLAQKSRAAGIHLVIATQRPTTDIITGSIKNNLATIVALRVSKQVDSVTVLGHAGAEILGGNGDMYLVNPAFARFGEIRVQGAYISDEEITRITSDLRSRYPADFDQRFLNLADKPSFYQGAVAETQNEGMYDPLYQVIKTAAQSMDYVSMSWISRVYKTGYPRALKIFKQLQVDKIIDDSSDNNNNNKGRRVLMHTPGGDE
jgi:DNA segregation ATPase FtsK/SpoIIIE-like protein